MQTKIIERIERLKRKKNAIILAHSFERPEVVDIADVVGSSSGLVKAAMETSADLIVVCGVDFMAETAAMLNPDKKVIIPDQDAKCPLARELSRAELLKAKKENPDAKVLLYINTHAETQALADCVCTAANAVKMAETMDGGSPIIFGPDRGLAYYVAHRSSKEIIPFPEYGICPVHHQISLGDLIEAKGAHPGAKVVAHPECNPEVQDLADYIGSTGGIVQFCNEAEADEFLVAVEVGLVHKLEKEVPNKIFCPVSTTAVCRAMKMITVTSIEEALEKEKHEVIIPPEIAVDARRALDRMLELS